MQTSYELPELDVTTLTAFDDELIVVLTGEADLTNHESLRASLAEVDPTRVRTTHLELSGLEFCDLAAFRQLLAFAGRVRAADRRVFVYGANPTLRKVAGFLGAGDVVDFA